MNGSIRREEHFSVSTINFCAWCLHFLSYIFQYLHVLHRHWSLTALYVLLIWFFILRIALDVFMTLFWFCSSALCAMCATTIHPSFKRLLIIKCQIISFYLHVYALGSLVFSYLYLYCEAAKLVGNCKHFVKTT